MWEKTEMSGLFRTITSSFHKIDFIKRVDQTFLCQIDLSKTTKADSLLEF